MLPQPAQSRLGARPLPSRLRASRHRRAKQHSPTRAREPRPTWTRACALPELPRCELPDSDDRLGAAALRAAALHTVMRECRRASGRAVKRPRYELPRYEPRSAEPPRERRACVAAQTKTLGGCCFPLPYLCLQRCAAWLTFWALTQISLRAGRAGLGRAGPAACGKLEPLVSLWPRTRQACSSWPVLLHCAPPASTDLLSGWQEPWPIGEAACGCRRLPGAEADGSAGSQRADLVRARCHAGLRALPLLPCPPPRTVPARPPHWRARESSSRAIASPCTSIRAKRPGGRAYVSSPRRRRRARFGRFRCRAVRPLRGRCKPQASSLSSSSSSSRLRRSPRAAAPPRPPRVVAALCSSLAARRACGAGRPEGSSEPASSWYFSFRRAAARSSLPARGLRLARCASKPTARLYEGPSSPRLVHPCRSQRARAKHQAQRKCFYFPLSTFPECLGCPLHWVFKLFP